MKSRGEGDEKGGSVEMCTVVRALRKIKTSKHPDKKMLYVAGECAEPGVQGRATPPHHGGAEQL
jgi:hypothetical protein